VKNFDHKIYAGMLKSRTPARAVAWFVYSSALGADKLPPSGLNNPRAQGMLMVCGAAFPITSGLRSHYTDIDRILVRVGE
jgi:hypothetical protein